MSFTPLKQYKTGDDLGVTPQGMLVLEKDSITGFANALTMGHAGPDQSTMGDGLMGYIRAIFDTIGFFENTEQPINTQLSIIQSAITAASIPLFKINDTVDSASKGPLLFGNASGVATPLRIGAGGVNVIDNQTALGSDDTLTVHTVGTSSHTLHAYTTGRSGFIIRNTSTGGQIIWFRDDDAAAVVGNGIPLYPGESFSSLPGCVAGNRMFAIADGAGATVIYKEWTRG